MCSPPPLGRHPPTKPKLSSPPPPISFRLSIMFSRLIYILLRQRYLYKLNSVKHSTFIIHIHSYPHCISIHVIMSCHYVSVNVSCQYVIHIITNLIRIHLDNIYVNKLTMKQLTINICKLIHSCKHCTSAEYYITNIIK